MPSSEWFRVWLVLLALLVSPTHVLAQPSEAGSDTDVARLVAAMLADTPLSEDLRILTDEIGGRATGSEANLRSVDWTLERLRAAGVDARKEAFQMPELWLENSAWGTVHGAGGSFTVDIAAMPFSTPTPPEGVRSRLVDGGRGNPDDFRRLGESARGAFVFVETDPLTDIAGLFVEYGEAYSTERLAAEAGALGVVYMSSRSSGVLYRHNSTLKGDLARPMAIMERDAALRTLRLLRAGHPLELTLHLDLNTGGPYESYNVIAEIPGSELPDEVVIMGAHLDSWDLGSGALDNGANVAIMMDLARQMVRLGIRPRRTVRLALWNGEEQGLQGSFGYVKRHADELDDHVVAGSFDIGCGRINGFFTGGWDALLPAVDRALEPVRGLGPFQHVNAPIVGTDNYDFMMEGVANLVGNHEPATYGPNYHAASDQLHECDLVSVRQNAAIAAAMTLGLANGEVTWSRWSAEDVQALVTSTDLEQQMRVFGVWRAWADGTRGRSR